MNQTSKQAALDTAHERFSPAPEERSQYIRDNLHLLNSEGLRELVDAMKAVKAGDKQAIRRLADKLKEETEQLEQALLAGLTPEELQKTLVHDMNDQGGNREPA